MKVFDKQRSVRSVVALALVIAVAVFSISLIALTGSNDTRRARPTTPPTSVRATLSACQAKPSNDADFLAQVHHTGQAAYRSGSINVTRIGNYELVFGPLTPTDVVRFRQNNGVGLSFPMDHQFQLQTDWMQLEPVVVNGATYLHLSIRVADLTEPCTGLRAWLKF